ncbi:MAG: hypothetical protein KC912_21825 [Proteobacteria bacterium]|nr:hypothetical protein [Pseudomonadota bacterium]
MRILSFLSLLALTACGGDGTTDDSGSEPAVCDDGDTQAGSTACGLNDRGTLDEVCSGGQWTDSDTCDDADECEDDATDTAACWEGVGTWDVVCTTGAWVPSSDCVLDGPVLASSATDGTQADAQTMAPALSADGSVVVFHSLATNLVAGDTNGAHDVFRHDLKTGETTRVSALASGTEGNGHAMWGDVSADGRYVAFGSRATNLLTTDVNATAWDVFRYDADTGALELVSVNSDGDQANGSSGDPPAMSDDGRYVAFTSASTNLPVDVANTFHVYLRDIDSGTTTRISDSNGVSPVISPNGRFVSFQISVASGARAPELGVAQLYVYDTQDQSTTQVSVDGTGADADGSSYGMSITNDGDVVFYSQATNLVANDVNGNNDLFYWDKSADTITIESVATDGTAANDHVFEADATPDGSLVLFRAGGTSLAADVTQWFDHLYLRDVAAGTTVAITSDADSSAREPSVSADGRHVALTADGSTLATHDTNGVADIVVMPLD